MIQKLAEFFAVFGSRKDNRTALAGLIIGLLQTLVQLGKLPQDTANILSGIVGMLFATNVAGIAVEDHGKAGNGKQPAPPVAVLALGLLLGLAAVAPAAPLPTFDLGALKPAPTGRQRDLGVAWPDDFKLVGVVVVPVVEEKKTGTLYFLDPDDLNRGEAGAHEYLIAVARFGTVTSKRVAKQILVTMAKERLRAALARASADLAARLPGVLAGRSAELVGVVIGAIAGRWKSTGAPQ